MPSPLPPLGDGEGLPASATRSPDYDLVIVSTGPGSLLLSLARARTLAVPSWKRISRLRDE
ncbi:MAG: hypothetical protein OXR82_08425 [Gammaproteobacteria bacterium]|nr:hypothetical protein [Gammaproteobacteria bacterium]